MPAGSGRTGADGHVEQSARLEGGVGRAEAQGPLVLSSLLLPQSPQGHRRPTGTGQTMKEHQPQVCEDKMGSPGLLLLAQILEQASAPGTA